MQIDFELAAINSFQFGAPHEVRALSDDVAAMLPTPQANYLIQFLERTYIGRTLPGVGYQQALLLRCGTSILTLFCTPSDNESIGSMALYLQCYCPVSSSNIWNSISALKREQGLVEVRQAKYIAGNPSSKWKLMSKLCGILSGLLCIAPS